MTNPEPQSTQSISQPSAVPTTKVAAGGIAGALTVVLVFILNRFHVAVPADVASEFTVIFSFATSYLVKERPRADAPSRQAAAG